MKKNFYLAMALLFATMVGCQDDNELMNVQSNVTKTFYATFENGVDTRTALDEENNVLWLENDEISIFNGTTANVSYILTEGAGSDSGTFTYNSLSTGTESNGSSSTLSANVAYYPYDSNVTVSETSDSYTINATFPATQMYSASGTFGNGASPMVAVTSGTSDTNLKFKNVGAIFRLRLKGTAKITKVVFSADADLAGDCAITASNASAPTVSVTEGSKSITLDCGEGVQLTEETATNFVVAMLPVENVSGGMTITIYDTDSKKMVYTHKESETFTIERSKAYTTAEVTYSGTQEVTASTVQEMLDAATNANGPTVIQLEPGVNYGTLVFRPSTNSQVVDISDVGGDAAGNEKYSKYENITIIGAPGATVDQFDFQAEWITDISCGSYIDIKNLTVKDVTFSGEMTAFNIDGSKGGWLGIDGLTIDNCTMNDADANNRFVFQQISGYKQLNDKTSALVMTTGVKNLTINNCKVTGAYQVIESRAMEKLTITNNTFSGIKARDMLITSDVSNHPDKTYTGAITITGNTSTSGEERFIRASLNNSNATVTIKDNVIADYKGADSDFIKVDGATGTVTIEKNTFTVATAELLQAAIKYGGNTVVLANDIIVDEWIMFSETKTIGNGQIITVTMNGLTIDGNSHTLTVNSIESASNGNLLFDDASNLNIQDLTIQYADGLAGGIGLKSGVISNVNFEGGTYGILPGTGNITVKNCTFATNADALYFEQERDNLTVTGCTFNQPAEKNVILLRGDVKFTDNIINSGRTVNIVSGSPVVTGNNFNDVRLKVYSAATATVSNNTINNLVFETETYASTFTDNTLSDAAQDALNAATKVN